MSDLDALRREALAAVASASGLSEIEALRVQYLGKKGAITGQLKTLGQLPEADRPGAGALINQVKTEVDAAINARWQAQAAIAELQVDQPDRICFVAGAIGPTTRSASLSPDVNDPGFRNIDFKSLVADYGLAIQALDDAGADILLT